MGDEEKIEQSKDNVSVTFTLPKALHEKLLAEAESEDRNISQQVKRIVRLYYEQQFAV